MPVLALLERGILGQVPEAADQFAQLRAAPLTVVQPMPDWNGEIALRDSTLSVEHAPNVVGILEGSDPVLKQEYVVFSAHMDHVGTTGQLGTQCGAMGGDSICNGAETALAPVGVIGWPGLQPAQRPTQAVADLSHGERRERGLWGASGSQHPPVPLPQLVMISTRMIDQTAGHDRHTGRAPDLGARSTRSTRLIRASHGGNR
jgi:hypothetical protein